MTKKRIRFFSNIDYRLDDMSILEVGDKLYDVVVSFVLYEMDTHDRPIIVNELARKFDPGIRIVTKEPTKSHHGIDPNDIRFLMSSASLKEVESASLKGGFDATHLK
ncbi:MAG: class I SAM-dependent methyltransferase [Methanomassiliicoccales archaeon]|jgi:hypothetical protein